METRRKKIHRGELLKAAVEASPVKITQMTKKMGIARTTYYNHTKDPNLPLDRLLEYGKIIRYDFSEHIPEINKLSVEDPSVAYGKPKTLEEAIEIIEYWRSKFYLMLEKYQKDVVEKR